MRYQSVLAFVLSLTGFAGARGGDWPQFRGPGGAAQSEEKLPIEWDKDKNVQWKVELPGTGWSCPVVWGDKVFVTTAVTDNQRKPQPMSFGGGGFGKGGKGQPPDQGKGKGGPPYKGKGGGFPGGGFGGRGNQPPDKIYKWEVYCLNRVTGKTLWKQLAVEAKPRVATHGSNTYASETPITDGDRVYAYFGMTGVFCYDMDGKQLWKKDLGAFPTQMGWGTGSSPTLDGDRLFLQVDNEEKSFLVALNKTTGDELWRTPREERTTYSTPFIWKNKTRTEVVTTGGRKIRSYDPATGKLLWELGQAPAGDGDAIPRGRGGFGGMGMPSRVTATPVASDEFLYVGFGGGPVGGGSLFAVKPGASGDITVKAGETTNAGVAWMHAKAGPGMASPLAYKGYIYILEERGGMVSCYEAKTGNPAYTRERLTGARGFTSSPWAADGKLYCLDDSGQTFVLEAGPNFKLLGKNNLGEMCWSSPAAAGGSLLLRTVDHLYCIKQ